MHYFYTTFQRLKACFYEGFEYFLAPIHIKTKAEFEKDRFEVENALNKFCLKYPDLIMGFSVRHNSVMHPSVIDECGLGLPIFSVKPMITGEVLDRDYK